MTAVRTDFELGRDSVTPALRKLQGEVDKLTRSNQRLARTSKGAADTSNRGLQNMAAQAAVAAIAYRGLTKAISLGNDELAEQVRLQNLSRDTSITLAQAQSKLITNIGDVTQKQLDTFTSRLKGIRRETKLPSLAPLTEAAANILSALGGAPEEKRRRALRIAGVAAPFFRQEPEALPAFGGALGDIATAVGVSPEEALGFALSLQQSARVEEIGGITKLSPLLATAGIVIQPGVDPLEQGRQAAAIAAGFGTRIADPSGRRTKTLGATLFPKLAEATPGGLPLEQVARVRAEESGALREQILKGAFAADVKSSVREFLTGTGGKTGEFVREALPTIGTNLEQARRKARQLEIGTEALKIATTAAEITGEAEANLLQDTPAARAANARRALEVGLLQTRSAFGRGIMLRDFDLSVADPFGIEGTPTERAIRTLESEKRSPFLGLRQDADVIKKLDRQIEILERQLQNSSPVRVSTEGDE